jgi:hypothetical protein
MYGFLSKILKFLLLDIHEFSMNFIFFKTHNYCHLSDTSHQIIRVQIHLIFYHILQIHAGCPQWAAVSASKPVNFWIPQTNLSLLFPYSKNTGSLEPKSQTSLNEPKITPAQSQKNSTIMWREDLMPIFNIISKKGCHS